MERTSAGVGEMCQELQSKRPKVVFVAWMRGQRSSLRWRGAFSGSELKCEEGEGGRSWASDKLVVRP